MTAGEALEKITAYFGGEQKYAPAVLDEMLKILLSIDPRDLERVYRRMVEDEKASYKVGVSEILAACDATGTPAAQVRKVNPEDVQCEACGRSFRYHPCPTDDQKIDEGLHCCCPQCGFQVRWTRDFIAAKRDGKVLEAYRQNHEELIQQALDAHPEGSPYFSQDVAAKERAEQRRVSREAYMDVIASVAKAKKLLPCDKAVPVADAELFA